MKTKYITILIAGLVSFGLFHSCINDDVNEDALYTFVGESVASFCEKTPELSIFNSIIEASGYKPLLSLYGHFTCFAPTDSAFTAYFEELNIRYNELTDAEKKELAEALVKDHVIKDLTQEFLSETFEEGALPTTNMGERFLVVSYSNTDKKQVIQINKTAPILSKDNVVHNGVVHTVGSVIVFSQETLLSVITENENFKLFTEAFALTNLVRLVSESYDASYQDPSPGKDFGSSYSFWESAKIVHVKKLGYTLFAETDAVFAAAGITTINQLVSYAEQYYGTVDRGDYTSRENALNKFVSYHLLDRRMPSNEFIYSGNNTGPSGVPKRYEYYETMLHLRLMEFKAPDVGSMAGVQINTTRSGQFVGIDPALSDIDAFNGYIHGLTKVLVYDEDVMVYDVLNKRLRIDAYAIPSALTNNNIRWKNHAQPYAITPNFCGESFVFNEATKIVLWASESWDDHQADEIAITGWYDFTLRLPPVPPGRWEIRFGYQSDPWGNSRGIGQLFIDDQIQGIPVNMGINGRDPRVGWLADELSMDNGVENDKTMRNRGYMKGGMDIVNHGYSDQPHRTNLACLRVIIGTFNFQDYDYHYFRAKNVEGETKWFHLDYIEMVPVSFLDNEDRG